MRMPFPGQICTMFLCLAIMGWSTSLSAQGFKAGDANRDCQFDSSDFTQMFQIGAFETGADADWSGGDFNSDSRFDSADLILAFQIGLYEEPPYCELCSAHAYESQSACESLSPGQPAQVGYCLERMEDLIGNCSDRESILSVCGVTGVLVEAACTGGSIDANLCNEAIEIVFYCTALAFG